MAEQQQPKIRNVVITVIMAPSDDGKTLEPQHSVSVNGQPVQNAQLGLVLAGDLQLAFASGVENTGQMRNIASGARGLADRLTDQVLGALEQQLAKSAKAENGDEPPSDVTPTA